MCVCVCVGGGGGEAYQKSVCNISMKLNFSKKSVCNISMKLICSRAEEIYSLGNFDRNHQQMLKDRGIGNWTVVKS